jgi:hypothetical protein
VQRLHGTAMSHFTLAFRHFMHVRGSFAALLSALSVLSGGPVSLLDTICMPHTIQLHNQVSHHYHAAVSHVQNTIARMVN